MERIANTPRIHPLMAVAALSVITVCAAGTAALTGLLPSSKADVQAPVAMTSPLAANQQALGYQPVNGAQQGYAGQQLIGTQQALMAQQSGPSLAAPVALREEREVERPRVVTHVHKHVVEHRHVAAKAPRKQRTYAAAPAPAPVRASQPNYVGIGTGAVIGGLIGNQIGGGNGKKLATVAGVIGGGFLGNEIANRNR